MLVKCIISNYILKSYFQIEVMRSKFDRNKVLVRVVRALMNARNKKDSMETKWIDGRRFFLYTFPDFEIL